MNVKIRFAAVLVLVASTLGLTIGAAAQENDHQYYPWATDEFHNVWERTDRPVLENIVDRTWIWGPGANHPELIQEEYAEADDGYRAVQYGDKSRMEWPWSPEADPESPWFITQGLLATELMTGRLQLGENTFESHHPADRPAAGDPDDIHGPTYHAMGMHIDRAPREAGGVITEVINRAGVITTDESYAVHNVTDYYQVEGVDGIDKNIASVFWAFMNSETTIYHDGQYIQDDLFLNPFYAIGYPKTDAFWAQVKVDGVVQTVLIQCFERRCLTFTPGNEAGWQVESGNIGQHYYDWRYHTIDRDHPLIPDAGSFTFDGAAEATVGIDQTVVLTANVTHLDHPVAGFDVRFVLVDGEGNVTLNIDHAVTDSYGNAYVSVTGVVEGTANVMAFVDLDGSGTYTAGVDLDLGTVTVTVDDNGDVVVPDTGSFTFAGEATASVAVGANIELTAAVLAGTDPVAGATVYFQIDDGDGLITLSTIVGVTDGAGIATVTVTGVVAGEATVSAFVDVDASGFFNVATDIDLGAVVVTVTD